MTQDIPDAEWNYLCKQIKGAVMRWSVERGEKLPPALPLYALIMTLTDFCVCFGISREACLKLVQESPEWEREEAKPRVLQ